jgi:hypothetical protein
MKILKIEHLDIARVHFKFRQSLSLANMLKKKTILAEMKDNSTYSNKDHKMHTLGLIAFFCFLAICLGAGGSISSSSPLCASLTKPYNIFENNEKSKHINLKPGSIRGHLWYFSVQPVDQRFVAPLQQAVSLIQDEEPALLQRKLVGGDQVLQTT